MILILLTSFLLLITLFFECYGFIFRHIGAFNNVASLGYSLHVQVATIARIGTLLSYPLIAYQIESGIKSSLLCLIPIVSFLGLAILLSFLSNRTKLAINVAQKLFKILINISNLGSKELKNYSFIKNLEIPLEIEKAEKNRIIYLGTLAFLFTSSAIFITSIIANQFLDFRTTIIQSTPFISSIGTILSVVYFDPTLSKLIDKNPTSLDLIVLAWKARIYGSFNAAILFTIIYFFL